MVNGSMEAAVLVFGCAADWWSARCQLDPGCNVSDNHVCIEVFQRQSDAEAALGAFAVIISDRTQVSIADDRDVTLVFRHNIDAKFLDAKFLDVLC